MQFVTHSFLLAAFHLHGDGLHLIYITITAFSLRHSFVFVCVLVYSYLSLILCLPFKAITLLLLLHLMVAFCYSITAFFSIHFSKLGGPLLLFYAATSLQHDVFTFPYCSLFCDWPIAKWNLAESNSKSTLEGQNLIIYSLNHCHQYSWCRTVFHFGAHWISMSSTWP